MSGSGANLWSSDARPVLKLFSADEAEDEQVPCRIDGEASPAMRLREFFLEWFLPVRMRKASDATIRMFVETLDWWERLTIDPPLVETTEITLAEFAGRLERATYKRGLRGKARSLSAKTIENHLTRIDRLLTAAGPKQGKNRPGANLLSDPPALQIDKAQTERLDPFTWAQVERMFAEIPHLTRPSSLEIAAVDWWCGALACYLYTGWRKRTVFSLDWSMVEMPEDGPWWIEAPAAIVPKTKKSSRRIVHGVLREALLRIRPAQPQGPIFPYRHNERTLHDWHGDLQQRAGIAETMGWNAWRRTHAELMGQTGYHAAVELSRQSLDHSDASITTASYTDPVNQFLPRLPAVELPGGDSRQLTLF